MNLFKRIFGNGSGAGGDLLLSAEQFRTLVLHECARCNRNSHAFSLIHIDLRGNSSNFDTEVRRLTRKLVQRIRTTDEIGWLDDHSIGIFLPETVMNGAKSLANDACQGLVYQIYTYPWITGYDNDIDENLRRRKKDRDGSDGFEDSERQGQLTHQLIHHRNGIDFDEDTVSESGDSLTGGNIEELLMPERVPFWKRTYDILGSSVLLVVLSPLFTVVALYIKLASPGPVFFRQERMGYLGRPFTMVKFRTMKMNSDNVSVHKDYLKDLINTDGKAMTKLDDGKDSRLIPLAGILRKSCIDELPQLINVLRGDMSLVGPRPCLDYEAREFALWQRRRFYTKPGMTGLWQVSGKNRLSFKEMMRLDIRYADDKSASMDFRISIKTVPAILGQVKDAIGKKNPNEAAPPKISRSAGKWSMHHFIRNMFL